LRWMEITVCVSREDMDTVSVILDCIGSGGVIIEDPALIYDVVSQGNNETIAMEVNVNPEDPPLIKGYLPVDEKIHERLGELREALFNINPSYPAGLGLVEVEDHNWLERWREFYHPVRVGRSLLVRPTWESAGETEGMLVIEMDPGMAFGCGTHPTTTMCMTLLEDAVRGGEAVLDVGTGSGILAIAAARLGASRVLAMDLDGVAVRTARENVSQNGLEDRIDVREGNLLNDVDMQADIIVANIVADIILMLLPRACFLLKPGGRFITSGIISHRREEMERAITESGLCIIKTLHEGEWTAYLAESSKDQVIGCKL